MRGHLPGSLRAEAYQRSPCRFFAEAATGIFRGPHGFYFLRVVRIRLTKVSVCREWFFDGP
jgi:hypothetical protein